MADNASIRIILQETPQSTVITAQSNLSEHFEQFKTELFGKLEPLLTGLMEVLTVVVDAARIIIDLPAMLAEIIQSPFRALEIIREHVRRILDRLLDQGPAFDARSIIIPEI